MQLGDLTSHDASELFTKHMANLSFDQALHVLAEHVVFFDVEIYFHAFFQPLLDFQFHACAQISAQLFDDLHPFILSYSPST